MHCGRKVYFKIRPTKQPDKPDFIKVLHIVYCFEYGTPQRDNLSLKGSKENNGFKCLSAICTN